MHLRKITAIIFAAALCLSAVCCSAKETDSGVFSDLTKTADSVKQYYGDNVEFIFMADEYSDEVLMYTYGLMDEKFTDAVEDFVLTECDGMSADTFAVVKFNDGTEAALIEEAAQIMQTEYITSLKNKLAAYNPEEFEASDGYKVQTYDNAVMLVISSMHADDIVKAATNTEQ